MTCASSFPSQNFRLLTMALTLFKLLDSPSNPNSYGRIFLPLTFISHLPARLSKTYPFRTQFPLLIRLLGIAHSINSFVCCITIIDFGNVRLIVSHVCKGSAWMSVGLAVQVNPSWLLPSFLILFLWLLLPLHSEKSFYISRANTLGSTLKFHNWRISSELVEQL